MDVDGTLTDGKVYMGNEGELLKAFNIKDGCGIREALKAGITPIIITGRESKILTNRCSEIGITKIYQGVADKDEKLKMVVSDLNKAAYIGDDINDISCMNIVKSAGGLVGCPADAVHNVIKIADYVCDKKGGEGAVREFIEWLIE